MQERVFMGIGNKPFMDIQPSDAAISDRAVNCVLIGRGTRGFTDVFFIIWWFELIFYYSPGSCRQQAALLCRIVSWCGGRASWRSAQVSRFRKQFFFLLILGHRFSVPCGIPVQAQEEGGFRRHRRICITSRSSGGR